MRNAMFLSAALGVAALGALSLPGCGDGGSSGTGGTGGGGAVTLDSACGDFASAICSRTKACLAVLFDYQYGDQATCEADVKPQCMATPDLAGAKMEAADIQTCADAYSALSCDALFVGGIPEACRVKGEKADGDSCATAAQCSGLSCVTMGEGECGVCDTRVAAGGSCAAEGAKCEYGLSCLNDVCTKLGGSGDPCASNDECGASFACVDGACGTPLAAGAPCDASGPRCDPLKTLYCNPKTNVCQAFELAAIGEACGYDVNTGVISLCEADGNCDPDTEVCVAALKQGDTCAVDATTGTSNCRHDLQCVGGVCTTAYPTCQ